ncbi:MAG: glycosyl hydrolase [Gemmatimonadota bacterium]
MKRRHRILLSVLVAVASISAVISLVLLGTETEGPLGRALQGIGSGVSQAENRVMRSVRGAGRSKGLQWAEPLRKDPNALRQPDTLLLGAYHDSLPASLQGVLQLEAALGTTLPLIQIYTAWGDRPDQRFPGRLSRAIAELGSIPVITWEPWLVDFENRLHPELPLRDARDRGGLAAIAKGDYDFYIDAWARDAAAFKSTILVRFAHEMNDPYRYPWGPQNNSTGDFIAAWQRVHQRFRAAGASNVLWVWAPHVAYAGYEAFYPGADFVDWVATGVLNYGTVAQWSKWWSFDEIFGQRYPRLASFNKPLMIAEFGTLAVGGDRVAWYRDALTDLKTRFPAVHAILFFEVSHDKTVTYQVLDWAIARDTATLDVVRKTLGLGQ